MFSKRLFNVSPSLYPPSIRTICGISRTSLTRSISTSSRQINSINHANRGKKHTDAVLYLSSVLISIVGLTYAAVPLYRMICQATGLGGTVKLSQEPTSEQDRMKMQPQRQSRRIKISFNADTSATMKWKFQPQQPVVYVHPGETSLVFYTASNPTQEDIIGISTYNVVPLKAGQYFNKIQCFCFEEQKLKAGESIDMPVFFFIDPEFDKDPLMDDVREVTLSYTFFNAKQPAAVD